jgi:hypothetical protein
MKAGLRRLRDVIPVGASQIRFCLNLLTEGHKIKTGNRTQASLVLFPVFILLTALPF